MVELVIKQAFLMAFLEKRKNLILYKYLQRYNKKFNDKDI